MLISEFIKFTAGGLQTATFTQIRATLVERYRSIYGTDIDLSTGTADGEFVNETALIINNLVQAMSILYSNLDVRTASGTYLDALCALSNVTRKPATRSNASLLVTNTSQVNLTLNDTEFYDQAGTTWNYNGSITLIPNEAQEITVVCSELGQVQAPIGWIVGSVENLPITVVQENAANVGSEEETDVELRARRNQSSGAAGTTVLASLVGALFNLSGVEDVKIYNNNTDSDISAKDTTTVSPHSIYVAIRKQEGVTISEESIGTIIYEKLTPGIGTNESDCASANGTHKNYTYVVKLLGAEIEITQPIVYWKECKGIAPQITIQLNPTTYFSSDNISNIVGPDLIEYLNKLEIGTDLTQSAILIETISLDPLFKGKPTYTVGTITIASATNPDTYYKYTTATVTENQGVYTLTLT